MPACFLGDLQHLYQQVVQLLNPLLPVPHKHKDLDSLADSFTVPLFTFLLLAAKLSLDMRREPDTIYYFIPAPLPGSDYSTKSMTAANATELQKAMRNPKTRNKVMDGKTKEVAKITGWPTCIAYRKGSGKDPKEYNSKGTIVRTESGRPVRKNRDDAISPSEDGFRTRTIALAEVVVGIQQVTVKQTQLPTLREEILRRADEENECKKAELVKKRSLTATVAAAVVGAFTSLPSAVNPFT